MYCRSIWKEIIINYLSKTETITSTELTRQMCTNDITSRRILNELVMEKVLFICPQKGGKKKTANLYKLNPGRTN